MKSDITVIVPIYNAATFLRDSLDSIVKQTYKDWKCILVNDGSPDNSQSIIDEYCAKDTRFVTFCKKNEGGCSKAKLFGVERANTDYVMIVDADDFLGDEEYIEKMKNRQRETDADLVVSRMHFFEKETTNLVWTLPDENVDSNELIDGRAACLLTIPKWHIGLNGNLARKKLYDSLSEGDWAYIDEVHTREILIKCDRVAFADPIYYYRYNPSSITRKLSPYIFDFSINYALLAIFAQKHFSDNKTLVNELSNRHFSRLVKDIVSYNKVKDGFSKEERDRIETALESSFRYINIKEVIKKKPLKGLAVVALRCYSWFQRLVVAWNHTR